MSLPVALIISTDDELEDELIYQLGREGIYVSVFSNNESKLEPIVKKLIEEKIDPKFILFGSADLEKNSKVIGQIGELFGRLDILINIGTLFNHGQFNINTVSGDTSSTQMSFDTVAVSRTFIPLLRKSSFGCVVNVYQKTDQSTSKLKSLSGFIHHHSTKLTLRQLMDRFEQEFNNTNVKVNSIMLGDDENAKTLQEKAAIVVRMAMLPFIEPSKSETMRIVYGVVGEGMGHATRSKVTLELLMKEQHHVKVLVSNRAYKFLHDSFINRYPRCADASTGEAAIDIIEIEGLTMQYVNNVFDEKASVLNTVQRLPNILRKNLGAYYNNLVSWRPRAVISDFDSFAYMFAKAHGLPILSIDNQHVVKRCFIPKEAREADPKAFYTYKGFVNAKLPRCHYYIITGFFTPDIRDKYKDNTMLVPPILRQNIIDVKPLPVQQCEHYLVYQTSKSDTTLISTLQAFGEKCIVYGLGREEKINNLELKGFSEQGFINDLASAKGVIANGGLSLMNEAVALQRPFFSVPVENQYEQVLNGWYLQQLGFGVFTDKLEIEALRQWALNIPKYADALSHYHHDSNLQLCKTVKRVLGEFKTKFVWWNP